MKRKITTGIIAIICLIILIIGLISYNLFLSNISIAETEYIYIDKDDNADSVITKIKNTGAEFSEDGFKLLSSRNKQSNNIRPGRYRVSSDINTLELFRNIRNHNSEPIQLIVPSVRTIQIMASRLSNELMVDSAEIISLLESDEYLKSIGYNHTSIPSLFIPNTYEVYWEISAEDLIARMVKEHNAFWNDDRKALAKKIGLTELEVSTLASIVDSETANNGEKNRIAGLYMNRLHKNILLQSDPTVIYAVGDFSIRRVLNKHLQVESPYNTYKVHGLPPGPIRIPSIAGLDAVLNYEHNDYLYMCAKEDFSGTHNYAVSLAEHYANARRYVQALNERGIK
ncbi:MAG: endolytic transglycosylase MltG [Bacteroidaceae bacterium]|nr:endolytic transglycosylase MltG [Bacteroidaceae bacterium]